MKVSFNSTVNPIPKEKKRAFTFKKKEWPDDENTQKMKIDNPSGGVEFTENLRVIHGNEHPELFLLWLQDFRTKIWDNPKVTWSMKKDILFRLVHGEAKTLVTRTVKDCAGKGPDGKYARRYFKFKKHPIRTLNTARTDANDTWENYTTVGGQHEKDIIEECIHTLKFEIFGNDSHGKNSYTKLKRQVRSLRVDFTNGIRKWASRVEDFQSYLTDTLWEPGEKWGETMQAFTEMELREILDGSLHPAYHAQLINLDWDIFENDYSETLAKLESIEPHVIQNYMHEKRLAALEGTKGDPHKKGKANHVTPKTERTACKICGKFHKGTCRYAKPGDTSSTSTSNNNRSNDRKRKFTNKEFINVMQTFFQQNADTKASESDATDTSWKKGTTADERVYVLGHAHADQNCYDSDISIDSHHAKQYLKKYRKSQRKSNKKRKGN